MVIHTERLTLRPWRETDAASLFTYASVLDVGPAAGWPPHRSIEESREIIRTVFTAPHTFAICLPEYSAPTIGCGYFILRQANGVLYSSYNSSTYQIKRGRTIIC